MGVSQADNCKNLTKNLPISNPKPELHNINAHTKFGENPLMFTQIIIRKQKRDGCTADRRMFLREVHYEVIPLIFLSSSLTSQLPFLSICQPHNAIFSPTMME